jgi:hypothetical protein
MSNDEMDYTGVRRVVVALVEVSFDDLRSKTQRELAILFFLSRFFGDACLVFSWNRPMMLKKVKQVYENTRHNKSANRQGEPIPKGRGLEKIRGELRPDFRKEKSR